MPEVVRYAPDDRQRQMVEMMVGVGVPEADIARVLGIDAATLRRHYDTELATGLIVANARVAESLYRKAVGDGPQSVTAAMFWLKTRSGWREAAEKPGSGADAAIRAMSDAELEAAIAEVKRKIAQTAQAMEREH